MLTAQRLRSCQEGLQAKECGHLQKLRGRKRSPGSGRVGGGPGGTSLAHTWTPARREQLWTSDPQNGKKHICAGLSH